MSYNNKCKKTTSNDPHVLEYEEKRTHFPNVNTKTKDESNGGFSTNNVAAIYKKCTLCHHIIESAIESSKLHFKSCPKGMKKESFSSEAVITVCEKEGGLLAGEYPPSPSLSECSTVLLSDMSDTN